MTIRVEIIRAMPRQHESRLLDLPDNATIAEALAASGFDPAGVDGFAVHGERASAIDVLRDGDRLELLRPLQIDPKDARRRRALKPAR